MREADVKELDSQEQKFYHPHPQPEKNIARKGTNIVAIIGLTHRPPRPEVIGRVYKGSPQTESGGRSIVGRDLGDRLRFASDTPEIEAAFVAAFGSLEVTELPVLLAGNVIDEVWQTARELWGATGLIRSCTGACMNAWRGEDGRVERGEAACMAPQCYTVKVKQEDGSYADEWRQCPATGRLDLVLPALTEAGFFGVVRFSTHGEIDIRTIDASLRRLTVLPWSAAVERAGGIFNVPFVLGRTVEEINYVVKGTKRKRDLGVVTLTMAGGLTLPAPSTITGNGTGQALPLIDDDDDDEGASPITITPLDDGGYIELMMADGIKIGDLSNLVIDAKEGGFIAAHTLGSEFLVKKIAEVVDRVNSTDTANILLLALEGAMPGTPGLEDAKGELTRRRKNIALDSF